MDCDGLIAEKKKIFDVEEAERVWKTCQGSDAIVEKVESKEKTVKPPKLYDLTTLQREANRIYGMTAQQTLNAAQSLYEQKLITYPRTDSQYLTSDMEENDDSGTVAYGRTFDLQGDAIGENQFKIKRS